MIEDGRFSDVLLVDFYEDNRVVICEVDRVQVKARASCVDIDSGNNSFVAWAGYNTLPSDSQVIKNLARDLSMGDLIL